MSKETTLQRDHFFFGGSDASDSHLDHGTAKTTGTAASVISLDPPLQKHYC